MKSLKQGLFIFLFLLSLIGCNNFLNIAEVKKSNEINFETLSYSTEASRITGNLLSLQLKTCNKAVETVSFYVNNDIASRMLIGEIDFNDIGHYLPKDLSKLKRTINTDARSLEEKTVTLEEELNQIVSDYNTSLLEIIPDHSKALTLEGINASETGYLFGDDAEIPFDSLRGIMTTAVLNEVAEGKNVTEVINAIEEDLSNIWDMSDERAVTLKSTPYWPKGVVTYRWGSITDEHKQLMINAMKIWTDSTNNTISFSELDDDFWTNFTLLINVRGCVIYNTKRLSPGIAGNSYIGCIGGEQDLNLSDTLGSNQFVRTPVHELGHVLGLKHEQSRYDRDNYVEISTEDAQDSVNYGKVPLYISGWRWESRTVKIGWWRITLWYPAFWESENSWQSNSFDFRSVMLYSGLRVKEDKVSQNDGYYYTRSYSTPSENDIAMIKRMY